MIVRKVNVIEFMQALEYLFANGVDFVDMVCENGETEELDSINLKFNESYMNEQYLKEYEELMKNIKNQDTSEETKINVKLSDEDLNDLI